MLKVSDRKHSHLRLAGKLSLKKKGNLFFYEAYGIQLIKEKIIKR